MTGTEKEGLYNQFDSLGYVNIPTTYLLWTIRMEEVDCVLRNEWVAVNCGDSSRTIWLERPEHISESLRKDIVTKFSNGDQLMMVRWA